MARGRTDRYGIVATGRVRTSLWVVSAVLAVLAGCVWVTPDRSAMVSVFPRSGRGRRRLQLRLAVVGATVGEILVVALAVTGGVPALVAGTAVLAIGAAWLGRLARRGRPRAVRTGRRRVVADTDGPVVEAGGFAAISPGGGLRLARMLCALADEQAVTVLAEADGPARVRLYQRLGFEVVAMGSEAWAPALLVRRPQQRGGTTRNDITTGHRLDLVIDPAAEERLLPDV